MFKKAAVFATFCAVGLFPHLMLAADQGSRVVALSRADNLADAYSPAGKVKIRLREIRVETTGPYGKPVPHRMFLLFEPKTGAFSWIVTVEGPPTDVSMLTNWFRTHRAAFLRDNSLYIFTAETGPLALYVQGPSGHASSIDDAEAQAIRATAALNDPPGNVDLVQPWKVAQLTELSADFVHTPGSAILGPDPSVTDVQWDGSHWIVTLQARWTEAITLNAGYNVVSMRKVE